MKRDREGRSQSEPQLSVVSAVTGDTPVDSDVGFVADYRQGDLRQRRSVRRYRILPPIFKVQRESTFFCAAWFGSSGQICFAVLPALIASFSPSLLPCLWIEPGQ